MIGRQYMNLAPISSQQFKIFIVTTTLTYFIKCIFHVPEFVHSQKLLQVQPLLLFLHNTVRFVSATSIQMSFPEYATSATLHYFIFE